MQVRDIFRISDSSLWVTTAKKMLNFGCWLPSPEEFLETAFKSNEAQIASSGGLCSNPYTNTKENLDGLESTLTRQKLLQSWFFSGGRDLKIGFWDIFIVKMGSASILFKIAWIEEVSGTDLAGVEQIIFG